MGVSERRRIECLFVENKENNFLGGASSNDNENTSTYEPYDKNMDTEQSISK